MKIFRIKNRVSIVRNFIWIFGFILLRIILKPFFNLKFEGEENFDQKSPSIIILNHNSFSDAFILGLLPKIEAIMLVQAWAFKIPFLGYFGRQAEYFKMDENSSDFFIKKAKKLIKNKVSIIIFPEGTRAGTGPMGPFHSLAFKMAIETKAPIVPMVITGNRESPTKGSFILKPATIQLTALPPITHNYYKNMNSFVLKNKVRNIIKNKLNQLENRIPLPLADKEKVISLMPHKPPMLLIDKLLESENDFATSETTICNANLFTDDNLNVEETIFPELIAQTVALKKAYENDISNNSKILTGYVVSFKNFHILHTVKIFDKLVIRIENSGSFENLTIVNGRIFCEKKQVAYGEVRIWS